MIKWMSKILAPATPQPQDDHVAIEDIARLADGVATTAEQERLLSHINRCAQCYEILDHTIKDMALHSATAPAAAPWWKTKMVYALAASIILVFLISGQLVYRYWTGASGIVQARLDLNQPLKDILLEDQALRFGKGPRLSRLVAALQQKGLQIKNLDFAILSKPYYQKKSLFGPKEILHIRIENNIAYLEVEEKN